jgi:hypothetical protein
MSNSAAGPDRCTDYRAPDEPLSWPFEGLGPRFFEAAGLDGMDPGAHGVRHKSKGRQPRPTASFFILHLC